MNSNTVLWIYIVLLVAGGMVGFIKAKSKASLIASVISAALLSLVAMGYLQPAYWADIFLVALLVLFGMKFAKNRKFMTSGMMTILTVITLALYHLL